MFMLYAGVSIWYSRTIIPFHMDNPMRIINCEEIFSCTPQTLFDALHTPSSVRAWWHADRIIVIPREGGVFTAAWGEHEDDPMHVSSGIYEVFAPPHKIVLVDLKYHTKAGPTMPDAPISITYDITPHPEGAHLKLTHTGFPEDSEADAYFEACIQGWKMSLDSLRSYLTTSMSSP